MSRSVGSRVPALFLALGLALVPVLVPAVASAAPPSFEDGGFVYFAPGMFSEAIEGNNAEEADDQLDLSYQWSAGGGYLFRPGGGPFMATVGGRFEHMVYNYDFNDFDHVHLSGHAFRFLPEARIGGGGPWWFAYGIVAPGFIVSTHHQDFELTEDDSETDLGFNLGMGGGAMFRVWRGLGLGAEMGFDFAFLDDDFEPWKRMYTFDMSILASWWF